MGKVQQLKRRIRSIRNTRKITKTMEMVSASKLKRSQDRVVAARPFADMMREVIGALDVDPSLLTHPLLRQPAERRTADVFLFTSNRGLAGPFNANLVRRTQLLMEELQRDGVAVRMHVAGRRGASALRYRRVQPANVWTDLSDLPTFAEADRLAPLAIEEFSNGTVDEVWLVYARFNSPVDTPPVADRILPVGSATAMLSGEGGFRGRSGRQSTRVAEGARPLYILTPSAEEIFTRLLPLYVRNAVYRALTESAAAEHGARRTAMKNATDNAGELLETLNRTFNRARQAQITQEIAELMGGAEALKG